MFRNFIRWLLGEAWEKINLPGIYRQLKELGQKHGRRFFWAAVIWELIEDVIFPVISWFCGMPELIPLFLVLHFEPIVYPIIFWMFRMYDRYRGREPWHPNRPMTSSYWRSLLKVSIYKVAITGWFIAVMFSLKLPLVAILFYVILTFMFGFVHERIWHDSNYGILPNDTIDVKRIISKSITYRLVSAMIMYPLFRASLGTVNWLALLGCQTLGFIIYFALESVWASSGWGVLKGK